MIAAQNLKDANKVIRKFEKQGIRVLNGRFGPYITDGSRNIKVPKDQEPAALTLEECEALIAAAPQKKARARKPARKTKRKTAGNRPKTR